MNRRDFIRAAASKLREDGIKKEVSIPKQVFTISDGDGNSKQFSVKGRDKEVIYTNEDVDRILSACEAVAKECLKQGEYVKFQGFGCLGLNYRKPRMTKSMIDGEEIVIPGKYVPKFTFGNDLRMCARVYEMSLKDRLPEPEYFYDDDDEDGIEEGDDE